jgi:hypothetical protein
MTLIIDNVVERGANRANLHKPHKPHKPRPNAVLYLKTAVFFHFSYLIYLLYSAYLNTCKFTFANL